MKIEDGLRFENSMLATSGRAIGRRGLERGVCSGTRDVGELGEIEVGIDVRGGGEVSVGLVTDVRGEGGAGEVVEVASREGGEYW